MHATAVKEVHAVVLQAFDNKIDDVRVKFAESAKLMPLIVMMPEPESTILIGRLALTTGAADPAQVLKQQMQWIKWRCFSSKYRRS